MHDLVENEKYIENLQEIKQINLLSDNTNVEESESMVIKVREPVV